jgi:photosystem II stability/assembly factor-like uncharacterized protein
MASEDLYKAFDMVGIRKTTTEVNAVNDIATCTDQECAGDCGDGSALCDTLVAVCDPTVGATANVLRSVNGGATWAATAADPFAINEVIHSVVCLKISTTQTRILCIRNADAADNAEVAYSDDAGATWALGDITTPNNTGANWGGALFALDAYHIWAVLDDGYIAFSSDAGATWVVQDAGLTTVSDLHAVHFVDVNVGFCVGAGDDILRTLDGGDTWAQVTATGGAGVIWSVWAIDRYNVWVGDSAGNIYYSGDSGTTWTQRAFIGDGAGVIGDIKFANDLMGFIIGTSASDQLLRTIDGGYTWQTITTPTNSGLNQLVICGQNSLFAVGEPNGGTGVIVKASS